MQNLACTCSHSSGSCSCDGAYTAQAQPQQHLNDMLDADTFGIVFASSVGPPLDSYLCFPALPAPDEAFPDLSTAATIKDSRKEKKKKQTMSLADFQAGPKASYKPPSASSRARAAKTDDDIVLPTAPK